MLEHMGLNDDARRLRGAIRETVTAKDRVTPDLGGTGTTETFADALIERVGKAAAA
jgi:isocitrate dehydrogenase (NAD+)